MKRLKWENSFIDTFDATDSVDFKAFSAKKMTNFPPILVKPYSESGRHNTSSRKVFKNCQKCTRKRKDEREKIAHIIGRHSLDCNLY